jgi:hypothetical protein
MVYDVNCPTPGVGHVLNRDCPYLFVTVPIYYVTVPIY